MLFNTNDFLFLFLPITVGLFYLFRHWKGLGAAQWVLLAASLYFYSFSKLNLLLLVAGSIAINYPLSLILARHGAKKVLWLGIGINLLVLGVFKYALFTVTNINQLLDVQMAVPAITLPLGISFLTFHQISYLVDVYKKATVPASLGLYSLYIVFFPHLIAGPIVRHAEFMPQLLSKPSRNISSDIAVGLTIFILGLAKKVLLADQLALHATPIFDQAARGEDITMLAAWTGIFAYYFQIYFDFSGYSDMAIGLARLFGYRLPVNFYAPYLSGNITEFWRRWHMSLSRFLRDYLYIPLGGNRHGSARRYLNLLIVMVLGGFWHGAGWNFMLWGALHGVYLIIHHMWSALVGNRLHGSMAWKVIAWGITTLAVVFAWIFFRADNFEAAFLIIKALFIWPPSLVPADPLALFYIAISFFIVWLMPTPVQLMALYRPALLPPSFGRPVLSRIIVWHPSTLWALVMAVLFMAVVCQIGKPSEFIISGSDMQGYIIKFLLFFFIAAFAASAVVAYRYWGLHESDERGLLRYQIEKLEAAPLDTDTVFLGDSSLGNAIDIGLFDKLGSTHSLGLPLTGVYGYAGSYNLLQRVFDRLHPKQVVIFQSADLLLRPTEYDGLSFTLYKSWPSYLPLKQQILALHNMLIHLTEYQQVGDTLQRWVWGSWEKFSSPTDYPVQNIKGAFELTQNAPFSLSGINRDKLLFLRQIVDLCRSHGVNCVYAHGPLHEKLVVNNSSYFSAINAILEETGLSPACPLPLAMPNSLVGDSYDHVSPDEREQATRLYAAVLSQKWASQDPDCSRMRLSTH